MKNKIIASVLKEGFIKKASSELDDLTEKIRKQRTPDGTHGKPAIFTYTTYRLPTDEELQEFSLFQNLTAQDINQGFGYTIVGRGMWGVENTKQHQMAIKMLCDKFPDNKVYKEAYKLSLEE